jgi:hypothetical protein
MKKEKFFYDYLCYATYKNADCPIGQCPIGFGHMSSYPIGPIGHCPNPTMSK